MLSTAPGPCSAPHRGHGLAAALGPATATDSLLLSTLHTEHLTDRSWAGYSQGPFLLSLHFLVTAAYLLPLGAKLHLAVFSQPGVKHRSALPAGTFPGRQAASLRSLGTNELLRTAALRSVGGALGRSPGGAGLGPGPGPGRAPPRSAPPVGDTPIGQQGALPPARRRGRGSRPGSGRGGPRRRRQSALLSVPAAGGSGAARCGPARPGPAVTVRRRLSAARHGGSGGGRRRGGGPGPGRGGRGAHGRYRRHRAHGLRADGGRGGAGEAGLGLQDQQGPGEDLLRGPGPGPAAGPRGRAARSAPFPAPLPADPGPLPAGPGPRPAALLPWL